MQLLETEFTWRNNSFKQLKRKPINRCGEMEPQPISNSLSVCLYERTLPSNKKSYEVIVPKEMKANKFPPSATYPQGKEYPDRETYPSEEWFGTHGWYFQNLEDAEKKYTSLV